MSCMKDLTTPAAPEVKIPILNANRKLQLTGAMTKSIFNRTTPENIPLPLQRELKVFECNDGAEARRHFDAIMQDTHPVSSDTLHFTPLSLSLRHNSQYLHNEQTRSSSILPSEIRIPKRSPSPEPAAPAPSSRESHVQGVKIPSISSIHPIAAPTQLKRPEASIASGLVPECLNDEALVGRLEDEVRHSCAGAAFSNHNSHEGKQKTAGREGGANTLSDQNSHAEASSRSGSPSPDILAVESHNSCSANLQGSSFSPRTGSSSRYHNPSDFPSTKSQPSDVLSLKGETRSRVSSFMSPMGGGGLHDSVHGHLEVQPVESAEGRAIHPTWQPRTVKEIRPAWNQRIPPSKLRPVVSIVDSKVSRRLSPASPRLHTARSEEKTMARACSLRSQSRSNVGPNERLKTVPENAFIDRRFSVRCHAQPERANQRKMRSVPTRPSTVSGPKSSSVSVTPRAMSNVTPPSVRILFRNQSAREGSATGRTSPCNALGRPSTGPNETKGFLDSIQKQLQLTQQSAQIALERATHAEARCAEMQKELQESERQRRRDREELASNLFRLAGKVNFSVQWIHSYEGYTIGPEGGTKKEVSKPIYGEDGVRLGEKYQESTPGVQGTTPTPERSITSAARLPFSSPIVFEMRS